ncbi:hypothetical protein A1O3_09354 [Capronia epimyces CBS 606.96]|uniref:Uncharacterized protein n=1 Tax=Capronia epimyces CBS 606.96 TaxID=1182542 RepID=W9XDA2_9EURO|nr:uncharacterized protein A1O3_09354 [Capronia epimyces CBS 606.96]EXJ78193.1 hypothetical protein A1O3_09354 [Capronia epimyces CBS 606.96]
MSPTAAYPVSTLLAGSTLQDLAKRDGDIPLANNYALVCEDKPGTELCRKSPYLYYCKDSGRLARYSSGMDVLFCSKNCQCINLSPKTCIDRLFIKAHCYVADGIARTVNGTSLGSVEDAEILPDGTLDFSQPEISTVSDGQPEVSTVSDGSHAVAKRDSAAAEHSYALVCGNRDWTSICQKSSYGYYCTSNGALRNTGKEVSFCEEACECVDLNPKPKCILSPYIAAVCSVKDEVAYNDEGQILGHIADASIYPNGTIDFTSSTIASRDVDNAGDWVLLCYNPHHTRTCNSSPFRYACNKNNFTSTAQDPVCDEICKCSASSSMYKCISRENFQTRCHIEEDKVYEINGTLMGNLLGHLDDAVIQPDSTIDFSADTGKIAATKDLSEAVVQHQSIVDISATPVKRADEHKDHWVLFCGNRPRTVTCGSSPISYGCNQSLVVHPQKEDDFVCDQNCHCINQWPYQPCTTKSNNAFCAVQDGIVFNPNGTVLGLLAEAYVHPNGTLDFSQLPVKREVASRSSELFHMHCLGYDGTEDDSLTEFCTDNGYVCRAGLDDALVHLQHGSQYLEQCSSQCHCPRPFSHRSTMPIDERSDFSQYSTSEIEVMESNITAPPSGVPSQYSDIYQLDCGNRRDGPVFCSSSDLGYFCLSNGTVARSSTEDNEAVTWCDFYCKCIFRHPVPCVNEWNIPLCQELSDGTIRDASNLSTVIGTINSAWVMPNGSLLLDRGMPYVAENTNVTQAKPPAN